VQWYVEPSGSPVDGRQLDQHGTPSGATVFGRRYANYVEANQPPARYFGPNLSKLSAIRQKYDPNGVMFSGMNF
jgi:FAD/FMN-containing dehydrogenase